MIKDIYIEGDGVNKAFAIINTADYNDDGNGGVIVCNTDEELDSLGFNKEDIEKINLIGIGEYLSDFDFDGVMVIRIV